MTVLHKLLAVFTLCICTILQAGASVALGQEGSPFPLIDPETVVIAETININQNYTEKWGGEAKAPFQIQVPQSDDVTPLYHTPEPGFDTLIRISFVSEDQKLVENIRFTPMNLSMGPTEKRMQSMNTALRDEVFPAFTQGYDEVRYVGARPTKVSIYDAVELVGSYVDPDFGLMYLRIVGIINPDSENTIFAIANVVDAQTRLTSPEQYAQTRGGIMLDRFLFLIE